MRMRCYSFPIYQSDSDRHSHLMIRRHQVQGRSSPPRHMKVQRFQNTKYLLDMQPSTCSTSLLVRPDSEEPKMHAPYLLCHRTEVAARWLHYLAEPGSRAYHTVVSSICL